MDAKDQRKTHSPGSESHGVHVCNKCGWQFPNPHPSAKHRRAHKKICGTSKGHEHDGQENVADHLQSEEEHKTPSPKLVEAAEVKIGGIGAISSKSEQEVFEDAACEFSGSPSGPKSDSSKENEVQVTVDEKNTKGPDEIQQSKNSSSTACEMRNSGVSDSCEVSSAEVLETQIPVQSSVEIALSNQRDDIGSAGNTLHSVTSETMIGSSPVPQVTCANDTVKDVGLETEDKGDGRGFPEGNLRDGWPSDLASAVGKRGDASDDMWNDDVIYSEVEGPDDFALERIVIIESAEKESIGSEDVAVDTSVVKANAAQEIAPAEPAVSSQHGHEIMADKDDNIMLSVPEDVPLVEDSDVSLHVFKGHKDLKLNQSAEPRLHETTREEEYETDTVNLAESSGVQSGQSGNEKDIPSSDMLLLEEKTEQRGQDDSVVVEELHVKEYVAVSKIESTGGNHAEGSIVSEDIEIKGGKVEATESPSGTVQITGVIEMGTEPVSGADALVAESTADVNHTANTIFKVDSSGRENELFQATNDAGDIGIKTINEGNSTESRLSSESSATTQHTVSPVPDVDRNEACRTGSRETCRDSLPHNDAEVCESNIEGQADSSRGVGEENMPVGITNTQEDAIIHSGSTVTTSDSVETSDQKLPESERTGFHRVLGGLGVIQGNEINSNDKTQDNFAEVPVTIESNDHRDFGRLQNLSEAHIKSLVPSLVATTNSSNASEAANVIKSQPAKPEENFNYVKSENKNSAGDVALHSGNRCDSMEATWRSVSVQSDTPVSVDMELKKSNMKPPIDGPTRNDAEKPYKFVPPNQDWPTEVVDRDINKPENPPQSSSDGGALSENQEIIEKITHWSTEKQQQQQHVPLKNLLSEARSPQPEAADNKNKNSSAAIPRVSSILGPDTSPDSCFPAKGEVSEEWKTPARYPVDVKREDRKAKNRPFWVPFVCCSSVN